ncbi:glutamate receptor ionotropic, delta-1 [Osmia lignaria lignaria]|uniref:glutamate receptor ionotropic, delta-1 n=1 Tax=Osmia lignaria lignaria TaxID=1437193 RepID=UPI00402BCDFA
MTRMIFYTILSLLSVLTYSMNVRDAYDYVLLVTDVHNYYRTTCIVIVHSDRCTDLNETTVLHGWSRSFSRMGILTMMTSFAKLSRQIKKYQGYITRPLYVVLLSTRESMEEFTMLIRQIDISFPVWLLIFQPYRENPLRRVCQNPDGNPFDLSFDTEMLVLCYDFPILREWYALRDNRTRMFNLATWKSSEPVNFSTKLDLYERRNNMFGETMRIALVEKSPFVRIENGVLTLFFGSLVQELSKSMNFTIAVTDRMTTYGGWSKEEKRWTGVIGEVASNRVDFGVSEFSMSDQRMVVVDFTLPLILSQNRIYFKKPDVSSVQWSAYFKTFHVSIWTAIVCIIVSSPILLTLMKTKGRIKMKILADNYIHVWGIYCQQGLAEFPNENSMRLAFLSIFVSALITVAAYSASLISYLTVSTVNLPFTTVEGFAADGSYQLIALKHSADYDSIMSAKHGVLPKLKNLLKEKEDLAVTVNDGFLQVCTEKVGFYVTQVLKDAMGSIPCEVVDIEASRFDSLALVLNKGSPYTGIINYHLQQFKDNGILNRLGNTYLRRSRSNDNGYNTVTLDSIAPILAILTGGILLACSILLLEKKYYNLSGSKVGEICQFIFCSPFSERNFRVKAKQRGIRSLVKNKRSNISDYSSYYGQYEY